MADEAGVGWMRELDPEDKEFIRRLVLASGSLKDLAVTYEVSYPTIRARLDRVIVKIKATEESGSSDPFESKLRVLVASGMLAISTARDLLAAHRAALKKKEN